MTAVAVSGITVGYGNGPVISGMDLHVPDGSFFTLLGPSGCGKTTLLRTITGFISPSAGTVRFDDRDVTGLPVHKREIGMVFQDYALFPDKTVYANIAYGLKARKVDAKSIEKQVARYLDYVGLAGFDKRYPAELSGGQRQRVALARALVIEPRLLVMDEPLSNLDTKLRVKVRDSIQDLQRELKITTIFVTHDQEEALSLSDQIALLRDGKVEQVGTPDEIYERPVSAYAADFIGAANILEVAKRSGGTSDAAVVEVAGAAVPVATDNLTPDGAFLIVRPEDVHMERASDAAGIGATVIRRQYFGYKTTYELELTDGQRIIVARPKGAGDALEVGDAAHVHVAPEAALWRRA
jgi:iron(III) transport system ATP-binding protein